MILNFKTHNIYQDFFGHYMKSYLSQYDEQYENLTIINDKVQEIFTNSDVDDTKLKYYVCTCEDDKEWREYDYLFLTFGTFSYHDPYHLKDKKDLLKHHILHIIH